MLSLGTSTIYLNLPKWLSQSPLHPSVYRPASPIVEPAGWFAMESPEVLGDNGNRPALCMLRAGLSMLSYKAMSTLLFANTHTKARGFEIGWWIL